MRGAIVAALALAAALGLTACAPAEAPAMGGASAQPAPVRSAEPVPAQETAPAAAPDPDAAAQADEPYAALLEQYRTGLAQGWTPERFEEAGLCYLCGLGTADGLGWQALDLDGNGVEELIVGQGSVIYDLYTLRDGSPVRVLTGAERNSFALCQDGTLRNTGSNGAASTIFGRYALDGEALRPLEFIVFDTDAWFKSAAADAEQGDAITQEQADEILQGWNVRPLEVTPLV